MNEYRIIRVVGEINEASFKKFSRRLYALEMESHESIILELSSYGGVAFDALAFSDRMRSSPCDITVKAYGLVASAAVLILASGDFRLMGKSAWVMLHEDSDSPTGNVVHLEREIGQLRRMENQWAQLLASMSTAPASTWTELHKKEVYLDIEECLKLGLVDGAV